MHINCGPFVEDFPKDCPMCNTDVDHITAIFEISKEEEIKEISRLLYVAKQDCKQKNWEKLSFLLKGVGQKFGKLFK